MEFSPIKIKNDNALQQSSKSYDMIVFCHLRWEFVYQRPQHIISRMSKKYKVLYVEEPCLKADTHESKLLELSPTLDVLQPNVNCIEEIYEVLSTYIKGNTFSIGWFYSASFVPLLKYFYFDQLVYDCMDELTLFKGAPEKLIEQEKYLISKATVVFTGGKSLYKAKEKRHRNVHCFPSSVDQQHFAKALNGIAVPEDIAAIPKPIVGYFGVIDERIDLTLLYETAMLRPSISFVMIGPLAKIEENELPRLKNIHYLGMKDYKELPGYIKYFDLAMMPFALNDATKYISPTKTLEYMAAHKPIVSTAITDVVTEYSHCVAIVDSKESFAEAIDAAIEDFPDPFMRFDYNTILQNTSWDATAAAMQNLIKTEVPS